VLEQAETVLTVPPPARAEDLASVKPQVNAPSPRSPTRSLPQKEKPAPIVAEPPRPDDPGPELQEETQPPRGFSLFGWRPGPTV
jgi:hypothetical protein